MSKRKRLPPAISTQDRISDLPDAIVCHILSFLPTNLAVSTSILSKRWKPIWLSVTTLDMFDFFSYSALRSVMRSRNINLPILLFRLNCDSYEFNRYERKILKFINSAIRRGVQTLEFSLFSRALKMKTFSNILTCKTLTLLKLTGVYIDKHIPQINDSSIKTLHLNYVYFAPKVMVSFFLAFPNLEELQANQVPMIDRKTELFSQPMIKFLPNLMTANISNIELILWLRICSSLILNIDEKPYLEIVEIPIFYNLTQLELVFKERWHVEWKWILKMLQQSPNLQHLIIHEKREIEDGNWEDPLIVPECLTSQLKTCLFRCCGGTKCELKFVEYVMQNSKVLITMTIHCAPSIDLKKKRQILRRLSVCARSCELIFD